MQLLGTGCKFQNMIEENMKTNSNHLYEIMVELE